MTDAALSSSHTGDFLVRTERPSYDLLGWVTSPRAPDNSTEFGEAAFIASNDLHGAYISFDPVAFTVGQCQSSMSGFEYSFTISFQLYLHGSPLHPPIQFEGLECVDLPTNFPTGQSTSLSTTSAVLPEPVVLPLRVADAPRDTQVVCRLQRQWEQPAAFPAHLSAACDDVPDHWALTFDLFDSITGQRTTGPKRYEWTVKPKRTRDFSEGLHPPTGDLWRLDALAREHYDGCMIRIPWLDALAERYLQQRRAGAPSQTITNPLPSWNGAESDVECLWLFHGVSSVPLPVLCMTEGDCLARDVEFPSDEVEREWRKRLQHREMGCRSASASSFTLYPDYWDDYSSRTDGTPAKPSESPPLKEGLLLSNTTHLNLYEMQAALLSSCVYMRLSDAKTQPGPRERQRLEELAATLPVPLVVSVQRPGAAAVPVLMRADDVALLWRFSHYICQKAKYFLSFLRSVQWSVSATDAPHSFSGLSPSSQEAAAQRLMSAWSVISLADAFACLSPPFREVSVVRRFAIAHLDQQLKESESLGAYALPLVHAVRYDSPSQELARFLTRRCCPTDPEQHDAAAGVSAPILCRTWPLCCTVLWCAEVESGVEQPAGPLTHFLQSLKGSLARRAPAYLQLLRAQHQLVGCLKRLAEQLAAHGGDRPSRIERGKRQLRKATCGLAELFAGCPGHRVVEGSGDAVPAREQRSAEDGGATPLCAVTLPSHPERVLTGVRSDEFYIFKSAKTPLRITFEEAVLQASGVPRPLTVMFKTEDDIRQDELVLGVVNIMDRLLRQQGLDLHLSLYRVRPISTTDGILEIVPDVVTFESIKKDIQGFWRTHNPTPESLEAATLRYIKSLAGYSVVTFILGVGDRHLENILMTQDGRLLHIDFGFIFGNDPKPFSPPMKLCKEMIAALGGPQSSGFHRFQTFCCSAYNTLRQHAALLLHLLSAFSDAAGMPQVTRRVPHSSSAPHEVVEALLKVQERLRLDLTNTQATQYMLNVIADSVGSLFAHLWDAIHTAAQATRD